MGTFEELNKLKEEKSASKAANPSTSVESGTETPEQADEKPGGEKLTAYQTYLHQRQILDLRAQRRWSYNVSDGSERSVASMIREAIDEWLATHQPPSPPTP